MKNILVSIMLISSFQINAQDWTLVWSDEFNYTGLPDTAKWVNEVGFIRNNELQYYTFRNPENSKVENGALLIIGKEESYSGADYTSASLTTDGKYSWTYGKIEARIKLQNGQGIWPAFWLLGQDINQVGWPKCGELDIMEHINNENMNHGTMHWDNSGHVSYGGTVDCDVQQYHIYSLERDEQAIVWYLDGNKYLEGNIKDNINNTGAFHNPFYMILNLAIGGNWPGSPDNTTLFPDTMSVDYVRVYQKSINTMANIIDESDIKIFPNPAKDVLTIEMPQLYSKTILTITDLLGKEVITRQINDKNIQIYLGGLSKGVYILKFSNELLNIAKKVIKN
jgi:beta-glucanase (GH16 family)